MKYRVSIVFVLFVQCLGATEIGVKSLSGPAKDFPDNRLPSSMDTRVASNILLVDQRVVVPGQTGIRSTSHSSFNVIEGTGFSLVQVSSSYPDFGPSTFTGPNGAVYHFDGNSITCDFGVCDLEEADLRMEPFTDRPGGVIVFSVSGGEAVGGNWGLAIQDPLAVRSTVQMDSMISFDENVVEVVIDPIGCDDNVIICTDPCPPGEACIEPVFGLVEGTATRLSFFVSHGQQAENSDELALAMPIEIETLHTTVLDSATREPVYETAFDASRMPALKLNSDGFQQIKLPQLPAGQYAVRMDVVGMVEGLGRIERTAFYAFPILPKTYRFTGAANTDLVDNERIRINLELDSSLAQHNHVYAYAEIWSASSDRALAWVGGMTYPERVDDNSVSIALMFDARWLALAAETGKEYVLRNIRIQDPDSFIPIDQLHEMPVRFRELPAAAYLSRSDVSMDDSLYYGRGDISIPVRSDDAAETSVRGNVASDGILLVHGWCSLPAWRSADFNDGPTRVFSDPTTSRSHDAFAQRIRTQGNAMFSNSFSIVAHSQGGNASTHLRAFYNSRLDNSQAPRMIQTMGTPYGGSTLMDLYVASGPLGWLIGIVFTGGCEPQLNLTTLGSSLWRSSIPNHVRDDVYFYRTRHRRPSNVFQRLQFWRWNCKITSYVIPRSDDGVVSHTQGQFSSANNMGITDSECHTDGMKYADQKDNAGRNSILDREGRPPPPPQLDARCNVEAYWRPGGPTGQGYFEYWVNTTNTVLGSFPIANYVWTNGGTPGSPTSVSRYGPLFPGLPGQASSYIVQVRITDTGGNFDSATCAVP